MFHLFLQLKQIPKSPKKSPGCNGTLGPLGPHSLEVSTRKGVLSTTGHSTNFAWELRTTHPPLWDDPYGTIMNYGTMGPMGFLPMFRHCSGSMVLSCSIYRESVRKRMKKDMGKMFWKLILLIIVDQISKFLQKIVDSTLGLQHDFSRFFGSCSSSSVSTQSGSSTWLQSSMIVLLRKRQLDK